MEIEEQHPIPQQVSSYQFKLVGDMTLQQFFQVAGGALIALLLYSSGLPPYIKWPLILLSFLAGIAMAFFPLEDRPLAKWLVLFVKAIYSPTLYVWKQMPTKYSYFQAEPVTAPSTSTSPKPIPADVNSTPHESANLEDKEKKFLEKVSKDLSGIPTTTTSPTIPSAKVQENIAVAKPQVQIPKTNVINVEPKEKPEVKPDKIAVQSTPPTQSFKLTPSPTQVTQNVQSAKFSPEAAPPLPPTRSNVVVGQVVDMEGKIVENAILEIRDSEGRPARALRSNKLGHFMIVTPLANGNYQITTEKDGLIFDTISLNVKGEIIPPLAVWAKGKSEIKSPESIKV